MMEQDKIERINYLANKAKTTSLTKSEKEEQQALRKEYIANLRSSFKSQLTHLKVVDPEGNDVTPEKVKKIKNKRRKH